MCKPEDCYNCTGSCRAVWQPAQSDELPTMPDQELPAHEPLHLYVLRTLPVWWPLLMLAAFAVGLA